MIIDNIIIGYECLNKVKHGKDKKKKSLGALKLDINKALWYGRMRIFKGDNDQTRL